MEKRITFYPPQTWRGRFLGTILTLVALLLGATQVMAQDVSIDPTSGSLVTSVTRPQDTGYILGLAALWRHEQLALSMTGADRDAVTETGEIKEPSTTFGSRDGMLTIVGGRRPAYIVVSLPKGYRITGYDLVLVNNLVGADMAPNKNLDNKPHFHHLNTRTSQQWGTNNEYVGANGLGTMRFFEVEAWETDKTNSGTTKRLNDEDDNGYNLDRVRQIAPGTDWRNGQIGSVVLATAKADDGDTDINNTEADTNKEYKLSRHSNDMGNQLYFRLVKDYTFYGLSIKSFIIYFTAEGTFDAPVTPADIDFARRVVMSPFKTNKIDIGKMEKNYQEGHEGDEAYAYFSYKYSNVTDLDAYNYLYQQGAVATGTGTPHEVEGVDPHISPVKVGGQNLYALKNDVYYVEPPVSVHTSSGLDAPIGYRIVGAKIQYLWGDPATCTKTMANQCRITYRNNGTDYYLNDQLHFTTNQYTWQMDDYGNIYYGSGNNIKYLSCNGTGETRTLSTSVAATGDAAVWNLHRGVDEDENGNVVRTYIYYYSDGGNYYYLTVPLRDNGRVDQTATPSVIKYATTNLASSNYTAGNHTVNVSSYTPGAYKLTIYDKDGTTVAPDGVITVNSASDTGTYTLSGLNNDAVKFKIENLQGDAQALILVTLQLQALDPYINNMQVNCVNLPKELQMSQKFTATNFKVSGGSFIFYVPSELLGEKMDISFSELYSDYGDKTYWGETESLTNSRYSFVTSEYFGPIDGYNDGGLYDGAYTPNSDYTKKVITATAGNVRYKFNNAENLGNDNTGTAYLEEYPFSVKTYLSNYQDPDAAAGTTPTVARFEECYVYAGNDENPQPAGKFFVFVADETRYNIAPTTDWQHRQYAFYRMDVKAVAKTYEPVLTWDKVYESALYTTTTVDEDENEVEVKGEKPQFGLTLTTTEAGQAANGYLTVKQIQETINAAIAAEKANPTGNVPESKDQILYVDASPLLAVYNYIKTENGNTTPSTIEGLKEGMGANSLIYLPKATTTTLNNFAYLTADNTFRAGNHIVLTDKQPFYSKYDIQIAPANWATYTRKISDELNGQVENATIMLPFTLSLDGGIHTNPAETTKGSFTVNVMQEGAEMKKNGSVDYGTAFFDKITKSVAEANTPYMIHVEETSAGENDDFSFVIAEKGAKIIASNILGENNPNGTGWLHTGEEEVSATFGTYNYSFTNKATFSGAKFDRAKSNDVFYFANDKYLDLRTLSKLDKEGNLNQYLYIYPFRGVYIYERTGGTQGAKSMKWFDISFDKTNFNDTPTDIANAADADLIVKAGKGIVTMSASRAQDVNINTLSGMSMKRVDLNAGDTKTVNLPAGIYMINNVKVIVK